MTRSEGSRERRLWAILIAVCALTITILSTMPSWSPVGSNRWVDGKGGMTEAESKTLEAFIIATRRGGFEELDREVKRYAAKNVGNEIHPDLQLYFVQERLDADSTEQEFFENGLKPAQDGFRKTVGYGSAEQMKEAYAKLQSRVMNYELGSSRDNGSLGEGAKAYLSCYKNAMSRGDGH